LSRGLEQKKNKIISEPYKYSKEAGLKEDYEQDNEIITNGKEKSVKFLKKLSIL
jgi:hypothetical protein